MNTPEASIIIPVYNAENYLKQCLDSVKNQTFSDYEVILIDDGSTDRSGLICDQYATEDPRFRVWHQHNGGVSIARKRGLEKACGRYIFWVDADDWCETDLLEIVIKKFQKGHHDVVV